MKTVTKRVRQAPAPAARVVNRHHYRAELERLRLLLARHIRWLRAQWGKDSLGEYQSLVISDAQADRLLSGDGDEARATFFAEDRESATITRRIELLDGEIRRLSQRMTDADAPPALDHLARIFSLTEFERSALLLAAAPSLDESFGRLLAYAQDDTGSTHATPQLAISLLTKDDDTAVHARDSFMPSARLRRLRLLNLELAPPATTVLAAPLRIDERLVDYIRGVNVCDLRVAALLRPVVVTPVAPQYAALAETLASWSAGSASSGRWPLVNVTDSAGRGLEEIARALAGRLGLRVVALDVGRFANEPEDARIDIARLLDREAALMRYAYFVSVPTPGPVASMLAETTKRLADQISALVIVGSEDKWLANREMISVAAPRLDARGQAELWRQSLGADGDRMNGTVEKLVQQFDFGSREIHRAVLTTHRNAELRSSNGKRSYTAGELWDAACDEAGWRIDDLARRVRPGHAWDDLVFPPSVLAQLEEVAAQVKHRAQVYDTWGFGARLSRGRSTSACFAGPSGCGKSAVAEAMAHHLKVALYRIDLAGVVSKYIGETEKNLRRIFDAAEQSGAILFFDEADALFGKRTEVKDSHDRYANIEVNYLLQRMEDYRGLAILATNRKTAMDRAFLRRLRFLIEFPFPDVDSRRKIWRKVFPPEASVGSLDYEQLAQMDISGGNIKNIAVNAAFLAAADGGGSPIAMRHILLAAEREYAKIDKSIGAPELAPFHERVRA
jgi:hypothetical protein